MGVVDLQRVGQAGVQILDRSVIATLEKTPCQDAQPSLHLMEPGAMLGRKGKDMLGGGGSPRNARRWAPRGTAWGLKGTAHPWAPSCQPSRLPWVLRLSPTPS